MLDQDHLQKTIRAYISISVMMNSDTISPKTKAYLREASRALEEQLASLRKDQKPQDAKAA